MLNQNDKHNNLYDQLDMYTEHVSNNRDKNNKNMAYNFGNPTKEQFDYWDKTLSFPMYIIQTYKYKYPITFEELKLDGLNKQYIARYIYRNYESENGIKNAKMYDMDDNESVIFGKGMMKQVGYLSTS
jgi:hypothetical protein